MQLPSLVPGQRFTLPRPPGAADALLIAHLASARAAQGQLTLVVCAEPADSQRLADELPFFAPHLRIAVFPDWETLPYDQFSPHQDLVSERLATLWRLYRKSQGLGSANTGVAVAAAKGKAAPDPTKSVNANKEDDEGVDVVILPASTALTRLAPPSFLAATTFNFKQKSRLDEAALRSQLTLAGYSHVSSVVSPGEYAVRGGLIDLFPMGSNVPYRVDLFDNEVDSIRTFDPDTQRSLYPVPNVRLLPGREFALDEASRKAFRVRWRERIEGDPTKARLYKDMGNGIAGGGIEYYLPLFFDEVATIFDYLPATTTLVLHGAVDDALQRFWTDTRERHRFLKADPDRPILPPEDIFLKSEEFFDSTRAFAALSLRPPGSAAEGEKKPVETSGSEDHIRANPNSPSGGSDGRSVGAVTRSEDHIRANPNSPSGGSDGSSVGAVTRSEDHIRANPNSPSGGSDGRSVGAVTRSEDHIRANPNSPSEGSDGRSVGATVSWARPLPDVSVERGATAPMARLQKHIAATPYRVLLVADSEGRRETLLDMLRDHAIEPISVGTLAEFEASDEKVAITAAPISEGFFWFEPEADAVRTIQFITENELFATGSTPRRRRRGQEQTSSVDALIKDLSELKLGDPVVHASHGIGRYMGLINIDLGEGPSEFLHLEYADKATLYVPVAQLALISRYTGVSAEEAPLHKLGSGQWDKARRKAAEQVRDAAAELLNLYARRAARDGYSHRFSPHDYEAFATSFGFEETPDQRAAIHAVIQDLVSPKPMDRLVCGDVGFGKTEVALRAAFVAVHGGKQVALLAPTTLLAEQHFQTISSRFGQWPVKVAEMSRFRTAKEIKTAMEGLEDGTIDIIVGTHKLLSGDVKFKRLGLLIVDEEHRFGVRHKEAMKALRAEVDVLTLTATPIPRTLGMALEGLRDLSVIATAPQRRLAIKTFVRSETQGTIREAILRELKRGGQCYFLHNEVDTIQNRLEKLAELIPEARIAIAHGQMPERELESVMRDFVAQRINVLLCSTIIETGIDVPTANTIVISRADKFGLAQLHQLRGRVGRSHHQAYAYLMVPDVEGLTKQAAQRLDAIQAMEELGSGFYLAMHDLEIRGAGEVLGENQSGNMMEVGFQLYNDMLSEAVRALKSGKEPDLLSPTGAFGGGIDIKLHAPALLPDAYCGDVQTRLSLYKRLATADRPETLDNLLEEITDRFGKLPPQGQTLFDTHRLRVLAKSYGVLKVDANPKVMNITFRPNPPIDPMRIIELVQKNRAVKLAGNDRLRIDRELAEPHERAQFVRDLLRSLGPPKAQEA